MEEILHILNGDATLNSFEQTGLDGDVIVWREVLSEGPVEENIASGSFWKNRSEWISKAFDDSPDSYEEKVINQLSTLSEPYKEINLWFEYDLHCQINMLGVIVMLSKHTDLSTPGIYLICPGSYPGIANFKGMGELDADQLEHLYDNIRVQLGEPDFYVAAEAWKYYTANNIDALNKWLHENNYWANLHFLKNALQAHVKRSTINHNGLNYIEQTLLDIYNSGIHHKTGIYNAFWQTENIYGMGDMEIDIYLGRLWDKQLIDIK
ncbi:DUF1835 domain-containing protein [Mucilaginibacter sp. L196]|uniref:DUF1835 domain-containing protein n=1 Tax=Mucilaginibacter sp. L196 TaxID=1641870 RepID=UPI00131CB02E|nr:DUF1835 domain-containing protein [Mucilaginibacter sp. L196]